MKKVIILILLVTLFTACEKDNKGRLDPNAMISIWPAGHVGTKAGEHLSDYEIVRQTWDMSLYNPDNITGNAVRGFSKNQRDTINNRLLMWGTDIINSHGEYVPDFIEGYDIVIRRDLDPDPLKIIYDTIAYVPNSVITSARTQIQAAFAEQNFTAVYAIFDSAFVFIPVTGAEWRALKAAGQN